MEFFVQRILTVLFGSLDLTNKLAVANSLITRAQGMLDGEPAVLPVPADAPPEVPRILLSSKDGAYRCNVGIDHVELMYVERGKPASSVYQLRDAYLALLRNIAEGVRTEICTKVTRIGCVMEMVSFPAEDTVQLLMTKFMQEKAFGSPLELQLHVLHKMVWDSLQVNRWLRLLSLRRQESGKEIPILAATIDMNTPGEMQYDLGADAIVAFCSRACTHVTEELRGLFVVGQ